MQHISERQMELKIINIERPNRLGYNGFLPWPENITNVNSRPFKKSFDYRKYSTEQIYWQLDRYIGSAPIRQIDFVPSGVKHDFVVPGISVTTIASFLNETELIGGKYKPCEGDEIKFWKNYLYNDINGLKRATISNNTISLLYKNKIWQEGHYEYDLAETQFLLNGILEY